MDFGSEDFNVADWINSHMEKMMSEKGYDEEKSANSLLTQLQIQSRDESEIADQNIKLLTSGLPESMAKLSHVGSTVDELSESLRNLTNSGYKFKSGNVSEKISELSSLKVRRDRLRESAEILQNGIRIEEDLTKLSDSCNTGNLKDVCNQYISVSSAAKSLSSIAKFGDLKKSLRSIKQTIEIRLKQIMNTACSSQSSSVFSENALLSEKVTESDLPTKVVIEFITNQIKTIHNNYDNGDLQLIDWLFPCYNDCLNAVISFSEWCISLSPPIFDSKIRSKFIEIVANELNPSIQKQSISILKEYKFDELVQINEIVEKSWAKIPANWRLSETIHEKLQNGFDQIHLEFYSYFQSYLNSLLNPKQESIPKSSTTENLNANQQSQSTNPQRITPKSPIRSPSMPNAELIAPISTNGFDKKLQEYSKIAKNSLKWIPTLSTDVQKAILLSSTFLSYTISAATKEIISKVNQSPSKTEQDYLDKLSSFLSHYKSVDKESKRVDDFENEVNKLAQNIKVAPSEAIQAMRESISEQIVNSMSGLSLNTLKNIHKASEWSFIDVEEEDISDDDEEHVLLPQQSIYMRIISKSFFNVLEMVTSDDSLEKSVTSSWLEQMTDRIISAYVSEIVKIPQLSNEGQMQLKADIQYLTSTLATIGLNYSNDINIILDVLSIPMKDTKARMQRLEKEDVSEIVKSALTKSLSLQ